MVVSRIVKDNTEPLSCYYLIIKLKFSQALVSSVKVNPFSFKIFESMYCMWKVSFEAEHLNSPCCNRGESK